MNKTFICKDCNQPKSREAMCAHRGMKHGITGQCKACRSLERYSNGDYMRERIRKYGYRKTGGSDIVLITIEEMQMMLKKTTCSYCDVTLTQVNGEATEQCIDHVYPINDEFEGYGGENIGLNLATVCRGCNASKGCDHIYEFYERSDKFTPELWTEFVRDYGSRLYKRNLSDIEVEQFTRGFAEEAAELRANLTPKKEVAG